MIAAVMALRRTASFASFEFLSEARCRDKGSVTDLENLESKIYVFGETKAKEIAWSVVVRMAIAKQTRCTNVAACDACLDVDHRRRGGCVDAVVFFHRHLGSCDDACDAFYLAPPTWARPDLQPSAAFDVSRDRSSSLRMQPAPAF